MEKTKKKFNWMGLSLVVLLVIITSLTIYVVGNEKQKIANQEPQKVYIDKEKGKTLENFSKAEAVESLKKTLLTIKTDVDGKNRTLEERIKALDKESTDMKDVINPKTIDSLYLPKEFKENDFNRRFTASALLTYYQVITASNDNKTVELAVEKESIDDLVYLDPEQQIAQVPIDVFIGENKGISFEIYYIDGEWKLNPYTAMMSLIMIVNYEKQITSQENTSEKNK